MRRTRVIPVLLLQGKGLVKTTRFKDPQYVGDPINAIKIFNDKEVDELVILDIAASNEGNPPDFNYIGEFADECFMPVCYGGGLRDLNDCARVFKVGIEKVAINTEAIRNPEFIREAADRFGSQSIVVSMDVKKNLLGNYLVMNTGGKFHAAGRSPVQHAREVERMGAGEILLNSVDRDGTGSGYDLHLIETVARAVNIPVIACGGASREEHFLQAVQSGASAVAAGRMFVFHGKHKAVLISYPPATTLDNILP